MGSWLSFPIKKTIETFALPAPNCSYNDRHKRLILLTKKKALKIVACMYYKCNTPIAQHNQPRKMIIYSHGNGTDIGEMDLFLEQLSQDANIDIISYDYHGYGLSSGLPSEQGCIDAIHQVYKYVLTLGYKSEHVLLYGVSIGTGPTVNLAVSISRKNNHILGCLLQTPFTSTLGVISQSMELASSTMDSSLCRNPNIFNTAEIITEISSPIYIIHGLKDEIIPYDHAVLLFKSLQKAHRVSKLITLPNATHNSIEQDYYSELLSALREMISR